MIKCDFHIHSTYSDGALTIRELVDLYGRQGFGAIAITDHICEDKNIIGRLSHHLNYSLNKSVFETYLNEIKCEARRAWDCYKMLVLPGFEITKNSIINSRSAHLLIIGCSALIDPNLSIPEILLEARRLQALTIAAHPFYTGEFEFQSFHLWSKKQDLSHLIDAWEVNYRQKISTEILNSGLPLIANSDFHRLPHFTSWKTSLKCIQTKEEIFAAIRNQQIDFFLDKTVLCESNFAPVI